MKKYNDFIFEKNLNDFLLELNNDLDYISNNDILLENVENGDLDSLPPKYKKFLNGLSSKVKKICKSIKSENKFKKFVNSVISVILKKIKDIKIKKKILYFILSTILLSTNFAFSEDSITVENKVKEVIDVVTSINDKTFGDKFGYETSNKMKVLDAGEIESGEMVTNKPVLRKSMNKFLKELAFKESSGNWKSVNKYGYIGLYQFGEIALKDVGIDTDKINSEKFKEDPNIFPESEQNKAMIKLLKNNKHYMRRFLKHVGENIPIYDENDKKIGEVKVTESGILAASHLVGNKSVKKFLRSNGKKNPKDANGVSCSDYMQKFGGYQLNI